MTTEDRKTSLPPTVDEKAGSQAHTISHENDATSIKNPENEAEKPAPMTKSDQGKAEPRPKPQDPQGQQGSTEPSKDH